ncbi:MAG: Flp pilus assembly complex ATPase component TadA [Oscillospiraceae bacterium]|nr:Flp pilus assembly complex ATPase component TadA [Oscillospiraceae bacterium]
MKWNEQQLLSILPQRLRNADFRDTRELRLRLGQKPILVTGQGFRELDGAVTDEELRYLINAASRYSPWSAQSMAQGYITAPGGHRLGLCGEGAGETLREVTSVCIRVARDYTGIAAGLPMEGNLLILGAPGSGKTTLLRDYVRQRARRSAVCVVDERREIFPEGFDRSGNLDVLSGVEKERGMDMALRCMSPRVIAMDEITSAKDCEGLIRAAWCGVELVATAHAGSLRDLQERQVYKPLLETGLFTAIAVLDKHQSWHIREVMSCSV